MLKNNNVLPENRGTPQDSIKRLQDTQMITAKWFLDVKSKL